MSKQLAPTFTTLVLAICISGLAVSSDDLAAGKWEKGVNYSVLVPPEDTTVGAGKVEVLELFMYTSPRSRDIQPYVEKWLKTKPDYIEYVREPSIVFPHARLQARLYFTLKELGRDDLHLKAFEWIFDPKHYPTYHEIKHPDPKAIFDLNLAFAKANGIDERKFSEIYHSKEMDDKIIDQEIKTHGADVRSTSTFVINGRYSTNLARVVKDHSNNMRGAGPAEYQEVLDLVSYLATAEAQRIGIVKSE